MEICYGNMHTYTHTYTHTHTLTQPSSSTDTLVELHCILSKDDEYLEKRRNRGESRGEVDTEKEKEELKERVQVEEACRDDQGTGTTQTGCLVLLDGNGGLSQRLGASEPEDIKVDKCQWLIRSDNKKSDEKNKNKKNEDVAQHHPVHHGQEEEHHEEHEGASGVEALRSLGKDTERGNTDKIQSAMELQSRDLNAEVQRLRLEAAEMQRFRLEADAEIQRLRQALTKPERMTLTKPDLLEADAEMQRVRQESELNRLKAESEAKNAELDILRVKLQAQQAAVPPRSAWCSVC